MKHKTTIEWTHHRGYQGAVWNPTTGCTRVSAGCDNCYAFELHDKRFKGQLAAAERAGFTGGPGQGASWQRVAKARGAGVELPLAKQYDRPFSHVQLMEDRVDAPLRVRRPTCYFVDSMSDLFHEDVPDEYLLQVWSTMERATWHRFLILTKRPRLMRERLGDEPLLPNVWLGTSVEDQAAANERIPHLLATPAAVRFLSCEPLLGPVDVNRFLDNMIPPHHEIDWVIVGGESGPRARPMDLAWVRDIVSQCRQSGAVPFVKQLGADAYERVARQSGETAETDEYIEMRELHGRDMAEWPEDLRIREFPR